MAATFLILLAAQLYNAAPALAPIFSPLSLPAPETSPVKNKVPRMDPLVHHSFFYGKSSPLVACLDPETVFDAPLVPVTGVPDYEYHIWTIEYAFDRDAGIRYITEQQESCKHCQCDVDAQLRPRYAAVYNDNWRARDCPDQARVDVCIAVYRCYCYISLQNPKRIKGIIATDQDYQDAIDNIPEVIKASNPNWKWRQGAPRGNGGLTFSNNRVKAPGTNEPYWLEGPDTSIINGNSGTWNWFAALSGGSKPGLKKRDPKNSDGAANDKCPVDGRDDKTDDTCTQPNQDTQEASEAQVPG
ncbi:hypothetical protein TWF694_007403 [Orbilia ellipsospora]|uniref:Uncharacterized protein n=1 Tax=Orbilia ellipsospora TaxID=2528407 RepID=A0AAV9XI33_9PEZI